MAYVRCIKKHFPKQTGLICVVNLVFAKLKLINKIAELILKWLNSSCVFFRWTLLTVPRWDLSADSHTAWKLPSVSLMSACSPHWLDSLFFRCSTNQLYNAHSISIASVPGVSRSFPFSCAICQAGYTNNFSELFHNFTFFLLKKEILWNRCL